MFFTLSDFGKNNKIQTKRTQDRVAVNIHNPRQPIRSKVYGAEIIAIVIPIGVTLLHRLTARLRYLSLAKLTIIDGTTAIIPMKPKPSIKREISNVISELENAPRNEPADIKSSE